MYSSHQSRGRILFDFFCTLIVVASCVGAWKQSGAWALLGAAAAAGLYGLVHLFDMRWAKSPEAIEPQRIDFTTDRQGDVVATLEADLPPVEPEERPAARHVEQADEAEPAAAKSKPARKAKSPRKGEVRRPGAAKGAKVIEVAPAEPAEATEPADAGQDDVARFAARDEATQTHIEPLFEPDPFVRMPRRAFGRRGQL